jgi:uncharacterized membrane protein YfcA
MFAIQDLLSIASGSLVGFTLGLVGGGGSILAVPLLIYVVGVSSPHVAIGTSAVAVAASAAINLFGHARGGTVKWPCALVFSAAGIVGAAGGAQLGKMTDGSHLLALFGALMIVIGLATLRPRKSGDDPDVRLNRDSMRRLLPMLIGTGLVVGGLSGFFGIGGGFLIVPGLMGATAMPLLNAIGSSLVSVTAFGLTTASSYAISGLVDWRIATMFIIGGAIGGFAGIAAARLFAERKRALSLAFSGIVVTVGIYVVTTALLR